MTRLRLGAAAAVAALLLSPHAGAQEKPTLTHRVQSGDTLQLLAAEYYGDRRYAVFIMVENELEHPRELEPGERLQIPIGRDVTTAAGDTLEGIAAAHLGDERRAEFLASFNQIPEGATIAAGQKIRIPFHVEHQAAARETLSSIAATYFGDSGQADLLRKYNFLPKDQRAVDKGDSIVVPIHHVRVRQSKLPAPDAESRARVKKRRQMQKRARQTLPGARAAWRQGDYAAVKRELTQIDVDFLDTPLAVEVTVLLGAAYVAFGDSDSAEARFRKALERDPDYELSAYDFSPKIRAVWTRTGGAVNTSAR